MELALFPLALLQQQCTQRVSCFEISGCASQSLWWQWWLFRLWCRLATSGDPKEYSQRKEEIKSFEYPTENADRKSASLRGLEGTVPCLSKWLRPPWHLHFLLTAIPMAPWKFLMASWKDNNRLGVWVDLHSILAPTRSGCHYLRTYSGVALKDSGDGKSSEWVELLAVQGLWLLQD